MAFALLFPLGGAIATAPASGHLRLFVIDGTSQAHIPLAIFVLSVVAMSVLFACLVDHTAGGVVGRWCFTP